VAGSRDLKLRGIRRGCESVRSILRLEKRMREKKISRIFGAENVEGVSLKCS